MKRGTAQIQEIYWENDRAARLLCEPGLIPAPGQYALTQTADADSPLPHPVFSAGRAAGGFFVAAPLPAAWSPGTTLQVRAPLGNGFQLPVHARRVLLVSLLPSAGALLSLLEVASSQQAEITLISDTPPNHLPASIEILPRAALAEAAHWADYAALSLTRDDLPNLPEALWQVTHAQALVHTPMPCGALAECGVCAIPLRRGAWELACKKPVIELADLPRIA
jgi:hypothetical protein